MIWNLIARLLARPAISDWVISRAMRTPYSHIIKNGDLYMERYWLFNPYPDTGASGKDSPRWQLPISIRIHRIARPDQDRDMHDHPWNARTIILRGGYIEERQGGVIHTRLPGDTATLAYGEFHRITALTPADTWTMFITGKYRGTWGFLVDGVKVQWRRYLGLSE